MDNDLVLRYPPKEERVERVYDLCRCITHAYGVDHEFIRRVDVDEAIMLVVGGEARWDLRGETRNTECGIPKEFAEAVASFCVGKLSRVELRELVIKYCPDSAKKHGVTYSGGKPWA